MVHTFWQKLFFFHINHEFALNWKALIKLYIRWKLIKIIRINNSLNAFITHHYITYISIIDDSLVWTYFFSRNGIGQKLYNIMIALFLID